MILDKGVKPIQWERDSFQQMGKFNFLFSFFNSFYLSERERKRLRVGGGAVGRGKGKDSQAMCNPQALISWLNKSQMLNRLSRPHPKWEIYPHTKEWSLTPISYHIQKLTPNGSNKTPRRKHMGKASWHWIWQWFLG